MHLRRARKESEVGVDPRPDACLNCDAPLAPGHNYCPDCGQDTGTSRVAVGELAREAWAEFVQIDSKMVRTLAALLFRPGLLTHEYLAGRRVRYLSPFKMYLVVAALFFALASWVGGVQAERADLRGNSDAPRAAHAPGAAPPAAGGAKITVSDDGMGVDGLPDTVAAYRARQQALAPARRDSGTKRFAAERAIRVRRLWRENKGGLVASIIGYFPGMMFFLLPLYALLLKLLFLRSDRLYVEHLVFALHIHTVFFLVCGVGLALSLPGPASFLSRWGVAGPATDLLWLTFAAYGFVAARRVYRQGVVKTLAKGALLAGAYLTAAAVAVTATVLYALARV